MPTMGCRTSAQFNDGRGRREDGGRTGAGRRPRRAAECRLKLRCDVDAPAAARDAVRSLVGPRPNVSDAMLVASELVSNAVRHSGATEDELLTVMLKVDGGEMSITVVDPGRSGTVARPRGKPDPSGGFGLRLVEELAIRWGASRADGHRVWAALPVSG